MFHFSKMATTWSYTEVYLPLAKPCVHGAVLIEQSRPYRYGAVFFFKSVNVIHFASGGVLLTLGWKYGALLLGFIATGVIKIPWQYSYFPDKT